MEARWVVEDQVVEACREDQVVEARQVEDQVVETVGWRNRWPWPTGWRPARPAR